MGQQNWASLLPGTQRKFKAATPIYYQGEAPRSGFYIKSGIIKAYTLQSNGDEQITAFFGSGDLLPLSWLFGKTSSAMYYYETIEACELISVTRDDVNLILKKVPHFMEQLAEKLISDQAAYLLRITALEQPRALEKILFTLYYLIWQFGKEIEPHMYSLDIKLTHSAIASMVGLTRETTAMELSKLKRKGVISYTKKHYTVSRLKLEKAMGEDSFSTLIENI